jgi:hypothetical protein
LPGGSNGGGAGSASSAVTIAIPPQPAPAIGKSPAYVSPNTASISIVVTPQGGTAYPAVVANVPGTQCVPATGGGYTCTITVTATFGVDTLAIVAYAGPNATGQVLSSGSLTATFAANAPPNPALNAVLTGVVKNIGLSIVHGTVLDSYVPVGQSATLNVVGKDATGAVILGTYDAPINVSVPAGSGISLGATSFADSSHTTSTITYAGAPTYYAAPTSAIAISATAGGGAITQSLAFNPTSTLLTFVPGDGNVANTGDMVDLIRTGATLTFATSNGVDNGELVGLDPVTGAQTTNPALGYAPNDLIVDPKFGGIWVSSTVASSGVLECYTSPTAVAVPRPVPTAGTSNPVQMTVDGNNHLWFASDATAGYVTLNGLCSTVAGQAQYQSQQYVAGTPSAYGIAADTAALKTWIGDANSANASVDSTTPSTFPAATALPNGGSVTGMGYDAAGNILVNSYTFVTSPFTSYMSVIPTGAGAFSATYALPPGSIATNTSGRVTGGGQLIAYGDTGYGGIGLLSPSNPSQATVISIGAGNFGGQCSGVAFDNAGQPWALCKGPQGTALYRAIITNAWNVFPKTSNFYVGRNEVVGVAGGPATLTFSVSCTGGMTCAIAPGFPRVVQIKGTAAGAASLTVSGSDGRSVVTPFAVATPPVS